MSDPIVDITEAVKTTLANAPGGTFSTAFTPVRSYDVDLTLESLATDVVEVHVTPPEADEMPATRGTNTIKVTVDVVIICRPSALTNAKIDPLMALRREIEAYLRGRSIGVSNVTPGLVTIRQHYSRNTIRTKRAFLAAISASYLWTG